MRGQSSVQAAGTPPGQLLATRRETHDHCGGHRLPGTARIERELGRQRPARYPGDAWQRDERIKTIAGGRRLLSPSTNTRAKYRQPHRSGGGHAHNQRDTGKDTRSSMALAASQFGRTAGDNQHYWGGRLLNEKNRRRGGKRRKERCTRGQSDCRHGARTGESRGGGREGVPHPSMGPE